MLVVFFLSSLKKIVEQMHQTMCKRKISKLLFCCLMLSQLLHQYVISLDFTQTGCLRSYVHGVGSILAITVRLEHDNKIMVTIRSTIIVKYRAFP
uniref:Uncharacterized protein n=1 Tax=Populus trichocarpa TaxID=3694 RepID=A0A2K1X883_POPTR